MRKDSNGRPLAGGRVIFLGSFVDPSALPTPGLPEIAFAGRSNVGKSSAINRILDVGGAARVSSTPGRTQAINLFTVNAKMCFADLPGYGFAKVPDEVRGKWKYLVEGYLSDRETLRMVVVLIDARLELQTSDAELIWGLREARLPFLVLATKADKVPRSKRKAAIAHFASELRLEPDQILAFSSTENIGLAEARAAIELATK